MGTTDFDALFKTCLNYSTQILLFSGIFFSFAVKTPTIFLNTWLLKAHVESPLGGSIILAGIVLKLSLYGIFRLILPLLPKAYLYFTYIVYTIGVLTIIYASLSTLRTVDVKELIAYSSVSHAIVYLLGVFSNTIQGIEGGIVLGLAHGLVSSGLFICVGGVLYDRTYTRLITHYGGVTQIMPLFSVLFFLLCLGNSGTPLTLNFVGEFLALYGTFERLPVLGALACSSIVFSAAYTFFMYNRIAFGGSLSAYFSCNVPDLNKREFIILTTLVAFMIFFGIFPSPILDGLHYSVSTLIYNFSESSIALLLFPPISSMPGLVKLKLYMKNILHSIYINSIIHRMLLLNISIVIIMLFSMYYWSVLSISLPISILVTLSKFTIFYSNLNAINTKIIGLLVSALGLKWGIWDPTLFDNFSDQFSDYFSPYTYSEMTLGHSDDPQNLRGVNKIFTNFVLLSTNNNNDENTSGHSNEPFSETYVEDDDSSYGDSMRNVPGYLDHFEEKIGPPIPREFNMDIHGFSNEVLDTSFDKAKINEGEPSTVTDAKNNFNEIVDNATISITGIVDKYHEEESTYTKNPDSTSTRSKHYCEADWKIADELDHINVVKEELKATIADPITNPYDPDEEGYLPQDEMSEDD